MRRTAKEQQADALNSLRIHVDAELRKSNEGLTDTVYRDGLWEVAEILNRLYKRAAFKIHPKRNRPEKLNPIG